MTNPTATLESLAFDWGDAYLISSVRDRWVALRRDARYFLVADTLTELETLIIADYGKCPVSRECDPPDAGDYLEYGGMLPLPEHDENIPDDDDGLDAETLIIVRELRRAFPLWDHSLLGWPGRLDRENPQENRLPKLCRVAVHRPDTDRAAGKTSRPRPLLAPAAVGTRFPILDSRPARGGR